jgi:hypothetical protein
VGFRLAELFVDISANDKPVMGALGRVEGAFKGLGAKLAGLAGTVGAGAFFYNAVQGASSLAETMSKVDQVFGDSTGTVKSFADKAAKDFGLVKQPLLDAASIFGLMAKGAGQADSEAAAFATSMSMLAADASSFYNVPLDTALEKIRAGLSGEAEPLRAFGVFLSDAAMQAKAAEMGLVGLNGKLDENQKITVRAALIQEGLAKANGDLARTIDGTANRQRKVMGDFTNAMNDFGATVMPIWESILTAGSTALSSLANWFNENKVAVEAFAVAFGENLLTSLDSVWSFAQDSITLLEWFGRNWSNLIRDALTASMTVFYNFGVNIRTFFVELWDAVTSFGQDGFDWQPTALLDGFEAATEQMPELGRGAVRAYKDGLAAEAPGVFGAMSDAFAKVAKVAPMTGTPQTPALAAQAGQAETTQTAQTSTLEGFASRLIEGAFGDKKHREQIKALEAIKEEIAKGGIGVGPTTMIGVAG